MWFLKTKGFLAREDQELSAFSMERENPRVAFSRLSVKPPRCGFAELQLLRACEARCREFF